MRRGGIPHGDHHGTRQRGYQALYCPQKRGNFIAHTIGHSTELKIKTLFAILLDINTSSIAILKKFGFSKWGHMPRVADFDGVE